MKKVVNLLAQAHDRICEATSENEDCCDCLSEALNLIDDAIAELNSPPCWETPEQHKERTGKEWPDDWAVYSRAEHTDGTWSSWQVSEYAYAKCTMYKIQIVCATEDGKPPDDWRML